MTSVYCLYILYITYIYGMRWNDMKILISQSTNEPIYQQIYNQIKAAILSDELVEGDLLPSIRGLAKDLRISVITTKRAYDDLERDGYIYSVAGKGSYVAKPDIERIRESYLQEIENHLDEVHRLSQLCGLSHEEIQAMLAVIWNENP